MHTSCALGLLQSDGTVPKAGTQTVKAPAPSSQVNCMLTDLVWLLVPHARAPLHLAAAHAHEFTAPFTVGCSFLGLIKGHLTSCFLHRMIFISYHILYIDIHISISPDIQSWRVGSTFRLLSACCFGYSGLVFVFVLCLHAGLASPPDLHLFFAC